MYFCTMKKYKNVSVCNSYNQLNTDVNEKPYIQKELQPEHYILYSPFNTAKCASFSISEIKPMRSNYF